MHLSFLAMTSSALALAAHAGNSKPAPQPTPQPVPTTTATKVEKTAPKLTTVFKLDVPAALSARRGSKSLYPFDQLSEVGSAFGVFGKTKAEMASVVSAANRRNRTEKKDGNGQPVRKQEPVRDGSGNITGYQPGEIEMEQTVHFVVYDVTDAIAATLPEEFKGATAIVQRDK